MPANRTLLANTALSTGSVLAIRVALLAATMLLLARALGPVAFGAFVGIAAVAVIAGSLASLGTHLVVMRDTAQDCELGEQSVRYAAWATAVGAAILLLVYLFAALAWLRPEGVGLAAILAIGFADTFLHPFLQLISARLLGTGRVASSQLLLSLPVVLRFLSVALLFATQPADALTAYCLLYFLSMLAALAVALLAWQHMLPPLRTWRPPNRREWADAGRYAVLNITAASPGELDKALSLRLLSAEGAGLYAAASRIVGATTLPVAALMLSALPRLFSQHSGRNDLLTPFIFVTSSLYGLLAGTTALLCSGVVSQILGTGYEGIAAVITTLAFGIPAMSLRLAGTTTLMTSGRPWIRVAVEGIGLIILGGGAVSLGTMLQDQALPVAFVLSEWAMAVIAWVILIRRRDTAARSQ